MKGLTLGNMGSTGGLQSGWTDITEEELRQTHKSSEACGDEGAFCLESVWEEVDLLRSIVKTLPRGDEQFDNDQTLAYLRALT